MTRLFDIVFSAVGLLVFSPLLVPLAVYIKLDSRGPVFYRQERVGRFGRTFWLYKFRSMQVDADKKGPLITVGDADNRITRIGQFIRKYKLDELPQLINVLKGEMSIVGPRPEVKKYVKHYTDEQRKVLDIRPGITDIASIVYKNENELLQAQRDPEKYYIKVIMPHKLTLNKVYISAPNLKNYFYIIYLTGREVFRGKPKAPVPELKRYELN
ncbi:MAG: sugar transferase [Sphingobacteriales bacterium]|nr:MAG: sugar transferase [Sphingobacteriales bacterium]